MVVLQAEFAAGVPALNADVFDVEPFVSHKTSKRWRKVKSIGIVGSNALADFKLDLYYGADLVASGLYNTELGLTNAANYQIPIVGGLMCAPDVPIKLLVTDASNTNPANIKVTIT